MANDVSREPLPNCMAIHGTMSKGPAILSGDATAELGGRCRLLGGHIVLAGLARASVYKLTSRIERVVSDQGGIAM